MREFQKLDSCSYLLSELLITRNWRPNGSLEISCISIACVTASNWLTQMSFAMAIVVCNVPQLYVQYALTMLGALK